ncbi:ABC transporter permease [Humibacter albus]|uniref:ABC transporter permease n=1 Tax=Humibacter albus TaxID=427754 RepID=UPI000A00AD39|nr:ABC transporter permease [Humibacter albus]
MSASAALRRPATRAKERRIRLRTGSAVRDNVATVLVAAVSALFGTVLVEATSIITTATDAAGAGGGTIGIALATVSAVFLLLAVYVASVVTANTFATVVAGRRRAIALLRVVGAEASTVRRSLAREGLLIGAVGAAAGLVLGVGAASVTVAIGLSQSWLPQAHFDLLSPVLLAPAAIVALTTWAAAWAGSRGVTAVSPLEATAAAAAPGPEVARARSRSVSAVVLVVSGAGLLAIGVLVGTRMPVGLLISFVGGVLSFSGVLVGARRIMPGLLRLVGHAFGRSPAARIAVATTARHPERSTRATMAVVIGVTLVTTFAVALSTYSDVVMAKLAEEATWRAALGDTIAVTIGVFSALVGFAALSAAIGLVNTLTVGMLQRTRELGLLRALGFSRGRLRAMILIEGAQLTAGAIVFGLMLGTVYGWAAAQSLLGSMAHGVVAPSVPWPVIGVVVGAGILLTAVSSIVATRRAGVVSPVAALAVE